MKLKELREEMALRQRDVAEAIGTSQTNIARWENHTNEPAASYVVKLAEFFNVSADYLLGRTDELGAVMMPSAPQLTAEEQQLIKDYRSLSEPLKEMLQRTLETWKKTDLDIRRKKA